MKTLDDIFKEYEKHSPLDNNKGFLSPLLYPLMAMRYIADCIEAGHDFQAVNGFCFYEGDGIQPDQSFDAYLENFEHKHAFYAKAGEIIMGNIGREVVFEICIEPKAD